MKWVVYLFIVILFFSCRCIDCPNEPEFLVQIYTNDTTSNDLDTLILIRFIKGSNFNNPMDSSLYSYSIPHKKTYLINIDKDLEREKVLDLFIKPYDKFEYIFHPKKNIWKIKVTNIKIKYHDLKGSCACDFNSIEELFINDALYTGPFEIK